MRGWLESLRGSPWPPFIEISMYSWRRAPSGPWRLVMGRCVMTATRSPTSISSVSRAAKSSTCRFRSLMPCVVVWLGSTRCTRDA